MSTARDTRVMSVGAEMIWGALDWLRRLGRGPAPSRSIGGDELQAKTRNELLTLAKEAGLQGRHRMSKSQLLASLMSMDSHGTRAVDRVVDSIQDPAGMGKADDVVEVAGATVGSGAETVRLPRGFTSAEARPAKTGAPLADEAVLPAGELTELPSGYGSPRLTLMEVEPCRVHAYWEIGSRDLDAAVEQLGYDAGSVAWVLRLYDVTYIDFDGTNAHSYFDVSIDMFASGWYVDLWSGEKSYCAEIGARAPDGSFGGVCRSNFVSLPRAEPAPRYEPEWLSVEGGFDKLEQVPEPAPEAGPRQHPATALPGADGERARDGSVPGHAAGAAPGPFGLTGPDGDAASAQSGIVLPPPAVQSVGQAEDDGYEAWAAPQTATSTAESTGQSNGGEGGISDESCGEGLSPATWPGGQSQDDRPMAWVATRDTDPASESTVRLGGGDGVSSGAVGVASMFVTEPGGGAHSDGQVSDEAPGGPAAVETRCLQQGSGGLGQISDVDVRQRYGAMLAGRLPTARGSEETVGKGVGPGIDPASLQIRVEGRRPVSASSEGVGSFGSGGSWDVAHREVTSAIDLKLNAEVVISGRAQPGQTVQVNGRWLKVSTDGTFSMRVALPVVKDDTEGRKK